LNITNITTTSATITWTTDELSDSAVGYSTDTSYMPELGISSMTLNHSVTISALTPGTQYNIKVKSRDVAGNVIALDSISFGANLPANFVFQTNPGPAISNVAVQAVSNSTAIINWSTNLNASTAIQYSDAISNGSLVGSQEVGTATLTKIHSQQIQNLSQNKTYYFSVKSIDGLGNIATDDNAGNFYQFRTTQDVTPPIITLDSSNPLLLTDSAVVIKAQTDELSTTRIAYKKSADSTYTFMNWEGSAGINHSFVINSLSKETSYDYYIEAADVNSNISNSNVDSFTTKQTQSNHPNLINPGNGNVLTFSDTQAVISVNTNTSSIAELCYSASSITVGNFNTCLDGNPADDLHFIDSASASNGHAFLLGADAEGSDNAPLTPNSKIYYRIKTIDSVDGSINFLSGVLNFTTKKIQISQHDSLTSISTPNQSDITLASSYAFINWNTDQVSNVILGCSKNSAGPYDQIITQNLVDFNKNHTAKLINLEADTKYYCQIIAADDIIPSTIKSSNVFNFTTEKDATFQHPPLASITFAAVNPSILTDTTAVISFSTDQAAKCFVERGNISGTYDAVPVLENSFNSTHGVVLNSLLFNTKYFYKVSCKDNLDNVVISGENDFTTQEQLYTATGIGNLGDHTAPIVSNISTSNILGEGVTINWDTDENANSLIKYGVDSSYGNMAGNDAVNSSIDKFVKNHSVTFSGLIPATKYFFVVVAYDQSGNIASSAESSFTTASPSALSSIKAQSNSLGKATITWQTSTETSSIVEYGLTTSYGEIKQSNAQVTDHQIELASLNQGTTYHYRVKGKDKDGKYFASSDQTFEPKSPAKISNISINDVTEHGATVSFKTDVPTDANVTFTDVRNSATTGSQGSRDLATEHKIELVNLNQGTTFSISISAKDEQGTEATMKAQDFTTGKDENPPVIDNIKTDNALTQSDKVQSIISWRTNEQSTTSILYREGKNGEEKEIKFADALTTNHVGVITVFKPGVVYNFRVKSVDVSGNEAISGDFALLTPKKKENIIQIIISNFTDIFGWANR
jgi:hypothetical protein